MQLLGRLHVQLVVLSVFGVEREHELVVDGGAEDGGDDADAAARLHVHQRLVLGLVVRKDARQHVVHREAVVKLLGEEPALRAVALLVEVPLDGEVLGRRQRAEPLLLQRLRVDAELVELGRAEHLALLDELGGVAPLLHVLAVLLGGERELEHPLLLRRPRHRVLALLLELGRHVLEQRRLLGQVGGEDVRREPAGGPTSLGAHRREELALRAEEAAALVEPPRDGEARRLRHPVDPLVALLQALDGDVKEFCPRCGW